MVMEQLTEEQRTQVLANIPVGRFCEPEEVAHTVRFLISPLAGFITGEVGREGGRGGREGGRGGSEEFSCFPSMYIIEPTLMQTFSLLLSSSLSFPKTAD